VGFTPKLNVDKAVGHIFRPANKWNRVRPAGHGGKRCLTLKRYASKAGLAVEDFSGDSLRTGFITSGAALLDSVAH